MQLGLVLRYGNAFGVESVPWEGGGGTPPPPFKRFPAKALFPTPPPQPPPVVGILRNSAHPGPELQYFFGLDAPPPPSPSPLDPLPTTKILRVGKNEMY